MLVIQTVCRPINVSSRKICRVSLCRVVYHTHALFFGTVHVIVWEACHRVRFSNCSVHCQVCLSGATISRGIVASMAIGNEEPDQETGGFYNYSCDMSERCALL